MWRALLVLALFVPVAAVAQPHFEITPVAGYRLNGEVTADRFDVDDTDLEVDESAVYGLLVDIPLTRNAQIELLVNRQDSAFILDEGFLSPSTELGDVTLTFAHAGFLFQWGLGQVNPYVVIAGGLTRIDPDFPELESETRLSGSFGGGVKLFFSENAGLRLEARGYWTDVDVGFEEDSRVDEGLFQGEGTVGLILAF